MTPKSLGEVRKAVVALIGAVATALTQGLITGTGAKWASIIIILATGAGVYAVPNDAPAAGQPSVPAPSPPPAKEPPL